MLIFVYSPSLLLITNDFDLIKLIVTVLGTLMGIGLIGIAFTGYWIKPLKTFEQWFLGLAALLFVAPGLNSMIVGLIAISPTIYSQFFKKG